MNRLRRPRYLLTGACVLAVLIVVGSVGLAARSPLGAQPLDLYDSARARAIFEMPFTKGIRTAEFHEVYSARGSSISASGVIEFAPQHACSETWSHPARDAADQSAGYREMDVGGVKYNQDAPGSKYRATGYDGLAGIQFLGWDGGPPPNALEIAGQTRMQGRRAWVLRDLYSSDRWVVAQRSGDPLEAVLGGGHNTYTFSDWGRAAAIQAPPAAQVSTARYSSSGNASVVTPAATVWVLKERAYPAAGIGDATGFRTIALEISYKNTRSAASQFDNVFTLVSPHGVSALDFTITLSPSFPGVEVAPGQTITGWDAFTVPRQATRLHLLFGEQSTQQGPGYLASIPVRIAD